MQVLLFGLFPGAKVIIYGYGRNVAGVATVSNPYFARLQHQLQLLLLLMRLLKMPTFLFVDWCE
jgi:hypothetical protein